MRKETTFCSTQWLHDQEDGNSKVKSISQVPTGLAGDLL
jgi:hypothetical protein